MFKAFSPTLFLIFSNDLSKNILRSLVNIYTDTTTVYVYTSKSQDYQCLAADHFSDQALTA